MVLITSDSPRVSPLAATSAASSGSGYRFDRLRLSLVMRDLRFVASDPRPGDRLPSFDLPLVGGGRFRNPDPAVTTPTLMVSGSATCPATDQAIPGLRELHRRFGDAVRFVLVNVREAHPGAAFPQPQSADEKFERACRLQEIYDLPFSVAVDDPDGRLHRHLGPKPNSAYLFAADGTILFRAHWAGDTPALDRALTDVVSGRPLERRQSGGVGRAMARMMRHIAPVLDRAGKGAWADMWRVAPPLTAFAFFLKFLAHGPSSR